MFIYLDVIHVIKLIKKCIYILKKKTFSGYINEFLSARFWIPLSRLTYSVYLIHMIVIHYMLYAANGSMHYSIAFTVCRQLLLSPFVQTGLL